MTFLLIKVLLLLLLVGITTENKRKDSLLIKTKNTEEIARLVTGIAIQTNTSFAMECLPELLKISKHQSITVFQSTNIQNVSSKLNEMRKTVLDLPVGSVKNVGLLTDTFHLLPAVMENAKLFSKYQTVLPVDPCETFFNLVLAKKNEIKHVEGLFLSKPLREFAESLDKIMKSKNVGVEAAANSMLETVEKFHDAGTQNTVTTWNSQATEIEEMMKVVKVLEEYTEKYDALVNLKSELKKMSGDVKSVLPIAKESERMEELSGALKSISESVERMNEPMGARELTVGLPGGTGDLEEIFRDLDGKWLKETIAGGKDMGKLKKLLEPLKTFTEGVKKVEGSWRNVSGHPGIQKALDLSEHLKTASDNGKQAGDTDPTTAIQAVSNCLESMKIINSAFDFTDFTKFYDYSMKIDNGFVNLKPTLVSIYKEKSNLQQVSADTSSEELIKMKDRFLEFSRLLESFDVLGRKSSREYKLPSGDLSTIRTALIESNLVGTVDCLKKTELNVDHVDKFLKLGDSAEMIKKKLGDTKDILEFLKSLMNMKKTLGEVSGIRKKTLRRRKRASAGLEDLKNSKQISIDLGHGVMALKKLEDVRKHQKTVLEVASCGDKADSLIRTLPQVSALWTTDNKNGLTDMVKGINDLDKKCSSLSSHDLLNLSSVFDLAADIRSVPIPSQLFSDPIATSLRASSDPDLQKSADAFQSVSTLQLDFASHSSHLRAASSALLPLQTFFDKVFGLKRSTSGSVTSGSSTVAADAPDYSMFMYVGGSLFMIALLITLIVLIIRLCKPHRSATYLKMRYKDARLKEVLLKSSRHLYFVEKKMEYGEYASITDAVSKDATTAAKSFIWQGAWINATVDTDSLLHIAISNRNMELVEVLIKHGASLTFRNKKGQTVIELCEEMIGQEKNGRKLGELKEIQKLILKFKKGKWIRVLPSLLPTKDYRIFLDESVTNTDFEKQFEELMTKTWDSATHVIVKTNDEGVFLVGTTKVETVMKLFRPMILMRDKWLDKCMESQGQLKHDDLWRVSKIQFQGVVYDKLVSVNLETHMPKIPLLYGFSVTFQKWPVGLRKTEENRDELCQNILRMCGVNFEASTNPTGHPYHFPTKSSKAIVTSHTGKYLETNCIYHHNTEFLSISDIISMYLGGSHLTNETQKPKPSGA